MKEAIIIEKKGLSGVQRKRETVRQPNEKKKERHPETACQRQRKR